MRGYASLIAGFIMAILLVTSLSVIFVIGMRESARLRESQAFVEQVKSLEEKTIINIVYTEWNKDTNTFFAVLTNTGRVSVDVNALAFIVDGVYVGRCGDVNCYEENPNGEFVPFEELNVSFKFPVYPHKFVVSAGPAEFVAYPSQWHSGCRYRRMIFVSNSGTSDLTEYQIPVDLPSDFNYAHAAADGSDVLFTTSDGITEIPYWIEYWNVSGSSRIWIDVNVPAGGSTYVYMYYGGCSPTSWTVSDIFDRVVPGLVAYWNFEEGAGSVASDVSGHGYDLNLYNILWASGPRGGAIFFSGDTTSYAEVSTFSGFPSAAITVFLRMETNDTLRNGTPFSYASAASYDDFLIYDYNDFKVYRGASYRYAYTSANDGVWHYIATYWDTNGNFAFYVDGVVTRTDTAFAVGTTITDGGTLVLGQDQDAAGFDATQSFYGYMDDVMIFDRVLSAADITAIGENDVYATPYYLGYALVRKYADPQPLVSVRGEEHI